MLKQILQKYMLKKHSSTVMTGFASLKGMKSAWVVVDATLPGWKETGERLATFFQGYGIRTEVFFLDLRKNKEKGPDACTGSNVINRRATNWFGMPKKKYFGHCAQETPDIFINLCEAPSYTSDFISRAARARFKIGSSTYAGNPFDLIFTQKEDAEGDKVAALCQFLRQVV